MHLCCVYRALLKEGELDSAAKCYDAYINMQTGLKVSETAIQGPHTPYIKVSTRSCTYAFVSHDCSCTQFHTCVRNVLLLCPQEFDRLCVAASRNQVEDEEVLAGLDKLERTLDEVLAVAAFA